MSYSNLGQVDQPRYSWGQGQTSRKNTTSHRGYTHHQPTWGGQRQVSAILDASEMIIVSTPFVRGMKLTGPGSDPRRGKRKVSGSNHSGLWDIVGSGTTDDPTVGWLFNIKAVSRIDASLRQAHVDVARKVAKANNFQCILIRKEIHTQQCTYTAFGVRNVITGPNGRQRAATVPAYPHMTVYMGPNTSSAMVGGHIFLTKAKNPRTGGCVMKQVDDPLTQRDPALSIEGKQPVAEEFWLTKDVWVVA